jgi:hypothetical protein
VADDCDDGDDGDDKVIEEAVNVQEEDVDECDADSIDGAIAEPEEKKLVEEEKLLDWYGIDDGMIDSIVSKGKRIKKGSGMNLHHQSSVGDLLQVGPYFRGRQDHLFIDLKSDQS